MCRFYKVAGVVLMLLSVSLALGQGQSGSGVSAAERVAPVNDGRAPAAPPNNPPQSQSVASSDMVIGPGDLLEVSVFGAPEFDKKDIRVAGSGDASLPMIGVQHLQGLTVAQAQSSIATKLAAGEFYNNPQVTVLVKETTTQGVSVLGEVQKPGVYPVLGPRRLFDAISLAGGLTPKAGRFVTITHRNEPDHPVRVTLGDSVEGSAQGNVEVAPGDTVMVSKAGIVYVVGDVKLPGGFVMEQGNLSALRALALAQGANPTAALNGARLIRDSTQGKQETPIPLKKILTSKAPDVTLQAGDILFIPSSAGKSAGRRSLEAVLQAATGIAIYHP